MSDGSVTIQRQQSTYLLPDEHPDPERIRRLLDGVMRNRLPALCCQLLSRELDVGDSSVWLVRRIDIDLALYVGDLDDESLARSWAQQIVTGIIRVIARGADGVTALRFPDRAAYLAQFAGDLAEGQAWGKWYYHPFESLRSLPAGAAICEALTPEAAQAEAALLSLATAGRLARVLNALGEAGAQRLYQSCVATSGASATTAVRQRQVVEALLATWPAAALDPLPAGLATARNALRLYLAVRARSPGLAVDGALPAVIERLLGFAEVLRRAPSPGALAVCLGAGDLHGAIALARRNGSASLESLPYFQQIAAGDGEWLDHVARVVGPAGRVDIVQGPDAAAQTFVTPFGGIFLLLPSLLDLRLHELIDTVRYHTPEEIDGARALRYLLALKCLGGLRIPEALSDPILHLAAGYESPPPLEKLRRVGESATTALNQACMRLLVERLVRRGHVEGRCLAVELALTPHPGDAVLLLRDIARDAWVYAACIADDATQIVAALDRGFALVATAVEASPKCLLVGPDLGRRLGPDALADHARLLVWAAPDPPPGAGPLYLGQSSDSSAPAAWTTAPNEVPEDVGVALNRYIARARPAEQDLAHLALHDLVPPAAGDVHFDLTWSLVARAVLRAFAGRLMGFDWSGVKYLYHNFLAGTSIVRIAEGQIDVQLPHSPLHILLRMAGVDGQTYTIPWLNGVQVTLALPAG